MTGKHKRIRRRLARRFYRSAALCDEDGDPVESNTAGCEVHLKGEPADHEAHRKHGTHGTIEGAQPRVTHIHRTKKQCEECGKMREMAPTYDFCEECAERLKEYIEDFF